MHTLHDLLRTLRAERVQLWVSDGRLKVRAPNGLSERRRTQLRAWEQALVSHLQQAHESPRPDILPLSREQEGMWFLERSQSLGAAYNVVMAHRLSGPLQTDALMQALVDLELRHEVLRTRYPAVDGVGTQEILPAGQPDIGTIDLRRDPGSAELENRTDPAARLQEEANHRFDIERESPFRCRLMRLGEQDHLLVLCLHHIAADASSIPVLQRDLAELYAARLDRRPARLPALPLQYADHALRQRRRLAGGHLDASLAYWTRELADCPQALDLPADRSRPAIPSFRGGLLEFRWPAALAEQVMATARRHQMTPFMLLMAAYQLLLARWSGQDDLCVGTPMVVRPDADTTDLVGLFLNTLVIRARIHLAQTVSAFLDQTRHCIAKAYEHSQTPFDDVVTALRRRRHEAENPLFQTLFAYEGGEEGPGLALQGLRSQRKWPTLDTAKFDVSLFMASDADGLHGGFEFATDLFDRSTLERLAGHFECLMQAMVASPHARLGDLPLLRPQDRARMLVDWNRTALALPTERTLHGLYSQRVASHGDRIAVVNGSQTMSHAALHIASNQLAHHLVALGVGPETVVGVCLPRCPEMIVALLGVLKAGAAYVPLDPAYPPARLAFMLEDSDARVLLSLERMAATLPVTSARQVFLDRDRARLLAEPTHSPDNRANAAHLAYIIYTSGSTGRPKGVAMPHASATAFVTWAESAFSADARALLASTSICFDLSIFELFLPLISGGTLILVDAATALVDEAPAMPPWLMNTVPSAARALAEAGALPRDLRTINLAGEPLPRTLVETLYAARPGVRVFNLYGPSEYTTYSTWCEVPSDPDPLARVSIGRPIGNTQVYLLDCQGEPVPVGTPGEIFVAGEGLARGYLGRPGLTAERFVPNPFGPVGSRMYATGDLGRFRADRQIDYLGRLDQQVKVRGFRIEPGEIEARLRHCEGVGDAAVITRTDRFGELQLIAHVVPGGGPVDARPSVDSLRAALARDLPAHMIPAVFEWRESLPMTPNGKVDRKALAALPLAGATERAHYVAPRDATESLLSEAWAHMLDLERVGIDDNFFDLGGHSLLASRIIARLRQGPLAQVSLRDLFVAPTVRALASRLKDRPAQVPDTLRARERTGPCETSFSQQRMWFIDQIDPQTALYNVCIAWRLSGSLDTDALHRSLAEIRQRHEILRTVFLASDEGPPLQTVTEPPPLRLTVADLSSTPDAEAAAQVWLQQDAAQPFDLAEGPLFRAALVRLGEQEHIVQLGMPHIVADGWSLDVILSELGALYPAFVQGLPSPLAPLPIQYADYARWERETLCGETLEHHLRYARELLAGAPEQLVLPWDRPRPAVSSYRGEVVEFVLDQALSEALRQVAKRFQVTLFMLLSSVFDVMLFRYSGQEDFCVGYSVGNRGNLLTEGLVGAFVNVLVHRARLNGAMPFSEHLADVRESMLDADAHAQFPFEKLVEALSPVRHLARHPIFQVTSSYSTTHGPRTRRTRTLRGVGEREVSLPGLALGLVEPGYQSAKFDLSLFISDTGESLEGDLEFSTDLFDRATIVLMARQIEVLCRAVVADPHRPLGQLDLLPLPNRPAHSSAGQAEVVPAAQVTHRSGPPTSGTERLLAALWTELLEREVTDVGASFFALGGHSITAIRLVARVARSTGRTLPLRAIFEHPVLGALAAFLDAQAATLDGHPERPTPIPLLDRGAVALAPAQGEV